MSGDRVPQVSRRPEIQLLKLTLELGVWLGKWVREAHMTKYDKPSHKRAKPRKKPSMNSFPVVGMRHHHPAAIVITLLAIHEPLRLVREPENPYDPNAIQVWVDNFSANHPAEDVEAVIENETQAERPCQDLFEPIMLGFIPRELAAILAPAIDAELVEGKKTPPARFVHKEGKPALEIGTWNEAGEPDFTEAEPQVDEAQEHVEGAGEDVTLG